MADWQTDADWQRVARYVKARRARLGFKQSERETSAATWSKLENARGAPFKDWLLSQAAIDLEWPPDALREIALGGEPPSDVDPEVAARFSQIEGELARQAAQLDRLERLVRGDE